MIQEEELEAVVRACLQVCKAFEIPLKINNFLQIYNNLDVYFYHITGKWNDLTRD